MKNGRGMAKDETADVMVAPACYWRLVLQAEREQVLKKKFPPSRSVCPDEATVMVSVSGRF